MYETGDLANDWSGSVTPSQDGPLRRPRVEARAHLDGGGCRPPQPDPPGGSPASMHHMQLGGRCCREGASAGTSQSTNCASEQPRESQSSAQVVALGSGEQRGREIRLGDTVWPVSTDSTPASCLQAPLGGPLTGPGVWPGSWWVLEFLPPLYPVPWSGPHNGAETVAPKPQGGSSQRTQIWGTGVQKVKG